MWSPYQICSDDSRDIKTAFEFFTQKREKVYNGPNGDPINSLTLAQLCTLICNDTETGSVDTFLYAPDSSGKAWCMTRHHTRLTFEETKKYVVHCIGLATFTPDIDTKTGNPTPDSLTKSRQIFDDQALDDSSHLWRLIVSYISPNLLTGLLERLEDYGNRGPGLLLWMALMDEVTSGSPQAMDSILENFKKIQLSDYPGENVRLMVHDIQASFNLLKSGQCLPITASSIVATKLLLCQVEEFRAVFYTISVKIDTEERGLMGKDNAALSNSRLHQVVLRHFLIQLALTQYKRLIDNERWPPSRTVPKKQSDSLPDAFQATVFPTAFQALADELKALRKDFETKPSGAGQDLSKTTCYKCGKIGHLRSNCPDKTTTYPENFWQNIPPTDGKFSLTKDG